MLRLFIICFILAVWWPSFAYSQANDSSVADKQQEREGVLFTKPGGWIDNPIKGAGPARSFYTSDDPAHRLFIVPRTIYVPNQSALEWAIDEVKSLKLSGKVNSVTQPKIVNIGNSDWVVLEWEDIIIKDGRGGNLSAKGMQYYSKKNAKHTLIEISVMGPKKVFDNLDSAARNKIYDFISSAKIESRSIDKLKKDGFQNELENKSRPASSADIVGTWEMFYQKYGSHFSADNPFVLPYQRFGFLPDGGLKSIGSTEPFDDEKMLRILWELAPTSTTTYEILKPGVVLIGGATGKYMTVISLITEDLAEPLWSDAPKLKKGDLAVAYVNPKKQVYLQRYLRKVDDGKKNNSTDTIVFKTGKSIEGKIIERTDKYIKIDFEGVPLTYFFDEIESIDGQEPINHDSSVTQEVIADLKFHKESDAEKTEPLIRELPFSTAIITYKDRGEIFNGEEIAYIDAKKNKVSKDTFVEGKLGCANKKFNKREICDGKTLYNIDFEEKTAPSFEVRGGDAISNIFMEEMYLKYYKGQKSFLGKECKVYSSMPGEEFYFWNGILLKAKVTDHPMGPRFNVTKEAVDIKLNVPIPDDKFEVPDGIKVMAPEETLGDLRKKLKALKDVKKEDWEKMKQDIKKIGGK